MIKQNTLTNHSKYIFSALISMIKLYYNKALELYTIFHGNFQINYSYRVLHFISIRLYYAQYISVDGI